MASEEIDWHEQARKLAKKVEELAAERNQAQDALKVLMRQAQAAGEEAYAARKALAEEAYQAQQALKQAQALLSEIDYLLLHDGEWDSVVEWRDAYKAWKQKQP